MIIKIHFSLIIFVIYLYLIGKINYFAIFYIFVILHEVFHSITAYLLHIDIKEINLLSVGVNAQYEEHISYNKELIIASSGPIITLLITLFSENNIISNINFIIFITNMIPIYPLDGGRILRIILIKIFGYKLGINMYGILLKLMLSTLIVVVLISTVYFKNYNVIFFLSYVFLLANREIKKERIKLIMYELIGVQL